VAPHRLVPRALPYEPPRFADWPDLVVLLGCVFATDGIVDRMCARVFYL